METAIQTSISMEELSFLLRTLAGGLDKFLPKYWEWGGERPEWATLSAAKQRAWEITGEIDDTRVGVVRWISASEHLPSETEKRIVWQNTDGEIGVSLNPGDWPRYFKDWHIAQWSIPKPPLLIGNKTNGE